MTRSRLEFEPGVADLEAAQPERLSDAEGLKFTGYPTMSEPILQSRAV